MQPTGLSSASPAEGVLGRATLSEEDRGLSRTADEDLVTSVCAPLRLSALPACSATSDRLTTRLHLANRRPPRGAENRNTKGKRAVSGPRRCSRAPIVPVSLASDDCWSEQSLLGALDSNWMQSGLQEISMAKSGSASGWFRILRDPVSSGSLQSASSALTVPLRNVRSASKEGSDASVHPELLDDHMHGRAAAPVAECSLCSHSDGGRSTEPASMRLSSEETPFELRDPCCSCLWIEAVLHGDCPAVIAQHVILVVDAHNGYQWRSGRSSIRPGRCGDRFRSFGRARSCPRNQRISSADKGNACTKRARTDHEPTAQRPFHESENQLMNASAVTPVTSPDCMEQSSASVDDSLEASQSRLYTLYIPCACRIARSGRCELEPRLRLGVSIGSQITFGCTVFVFDQDRAVVATPHFTRMTLPAGASADSSWSIGKLRVACDSAYDHHHRRQQQPSNVASVHEQRATWILPTALHAATTETASLDPSSAAPSEAVDILDGLFTQAADNPERPHRPDHGGESGGMRPTSAAWPLIDDRRTDASAVDRVHPTDSLTLPSALAANTVTAASASRVSAVADTWPASDHAACNAFWSFPLEVFPPLATIDSLPWLDDGRFASAMFLPSHSKPDAAEDHMFGSAVASSHQQSTVSHDASQCDGTPLTDSAWVDQVTEQAFAEIRERIRGKSKRFTLYAVTLPDLRRFYHLPRDAVARRLGICVTLLKKIARRNGVTHWPYRRLKTVRSKIAAVEADLRIPHIVAQNGLELRQQLQTLRAQLQQIQGEGGSRAS
ncbi:hypothetical protein CCYA_CCYA08G2252 [Cyanidiococcus yangmingshanensis]|nr:hypothetical protein CCYA_CCYA08G2252 [Cyanidiococcus yangmingshanensis]